MLVAGCAAALFGALCLHGYLVGERLETEGVTTKAVVTRVFSREESRPAPGYRGWRRSRKVTVYLLDYSFRVGGETYGSEVRRAGRPRPPRPWRRARAIRSSSGIFPTIPP